MGTKNQSMAAKRDKRKKAKRVKKPGAGSVARFDRKYDVPSQEQLIDEVAANGVLATAEKYRELARNPGRGDAGPDNKEIVTGMLDAIHLIAPIHSAVEIADILASEGKFELTVEDRKRMEGYDEALVKIAEDMMVMRVLMEEGQKFEDFPDIYVHYMDNMVEMIKTTAPDVYNETLKQHGALINEYAREHMEPGEKDLDFAMRMHDQRLNKVQHLYRTMTQIDAPEDAADETEQEFIPAGEDAPSDLEELLTEGASIKDIN
jgi:hypothetical protein